MDMVIVFTYLGPLDHSVSLGTENRGMAGCEISYHGFLGLIYVTWDSGNRAKSSELEMDLVSKFIWKVCYHLVVSNPQAPTLLLNNLTSWYYNFGVVFLLIGP